MAWSFLQKKFQYEEQANGSAYVEKADCLKSLPKIWTCEALYNIHKIKMKWWTPSVHLTSEQAKIQTSNLWEVPSRSQAWWFKKINKCLKTLLKFFQMTNFLKINALVGTIGPTIYTCTHKFFKFYLNSCFYYGFLCTFDFLFLHK